MKIDLNCDMGEGCTGDAELMRFITSANIACGFHAGDEDTMKRTVGSAIKNGVAIGAHPGYRDRENFGRTMLDLSVEEVTDIVTEQISALAQIVKSAGGTLNHVKPHGALYNQAAKDQNLAAAIVDAVRNFDDKLVLFGLSGSHLISEAANRGLRSASEVFADRTYTQDGSLTPRSELNALIHDQTAAVEQVLDMIKYGRVRSTDGIMVAITAETVCIHGDGENALQFAMAVNRSLRENKIDVAPV